MPPVLSEIHGTWSLSYCALALKNERFRKDDHRSHIFCFEILSWTILHPKELKFQLLRPGIVSLHLMVFPSRKNILRFWCAEGLVCRGVPSSPVFRCHRNQNDTRETQTRFLGATGTSGSAAGSIRRRKPWPLGLQCIRNYFP